MTYGLGIYLLNGFIGFLSPQVDPDSEGPVLPTSNDEEFRPFSRRVPEFKFWYSSTKGVVIAFIMTFFSIFEVPDDRCEYISHPTDGRCGGVLNCIQSAHDVPRRTGSFGILSIDDLGKNAFCRRSGDVPLSLQSHTSSSGSPHCVRVPLLFRYLEPRLSGPMLFRYLIPLP